MQKMDGILFLSGKNHMTDQDTACEHTILVKYGIAALTDHLLDGLGSVLEIVRCPGIFLGYIRRKIFEIWKIYIHISLQCPKCFYPFIASAVVYHWYMKKGTNFIQHRQYGREKMCGSDQVDILSSFFLQFEKDFPQSFRRDFFSEISLADRIILTVTAF